MAESAADLGFEDIAGLDVHAARGFPHEAFSLLRRDAPVRWFERNDKESFWAVTKMEDVRTVLRESEIFTSSRGFTLDTIGEPATPVMFSYEDPKHATYRKLLLERFRPSGVKRMEAQVERLGAQLIDDLEARHGKTGECDFVTDVARRLPLSIIALLLGIPEHDWDFLVELADIALGSEDPEYQQTGDAAIEIESDARQRIIEYFMKLIESKAGSGADDLTTVLAGSGMPPEEVLGNCLIFILAGNETTRNAISGGLLALLDHPEALERLRNDLTLLPRAVDEILRWTSPVMHLARWATQDYELRGKTIRAGEAVGIFLPSANRDDEAFDDPFEFQIDRSPNRHVAFGSGPHVCIGAHVARLELEVTFRHVLQRISEIELVGPVERLRSPIVAGIKHMPVRYRM